MKKRKLLFEALEQRNLLAGFLPYLQDFSAPTGPEWEYASTNEGRIELVGGRLRMDDTTGNSTYSQNDAILHLDLTGVDDAMLTGEHWNLKDEKHSGDGIFVSDGIDWTKVNTFNVATSGVFSVKLSSLGVPLTADYQIKFSQYDNYSSDVPYDGREWDDIRVEEIVPPTPQTLPYTQDFASLPGSTEGWGYDSTNEGRIQETNGRLRMDDTTGNSTYSQNYATLHIEPTTNAQLTGEHWNLKDETHSGDGIFTSVDGVNWVDADINLSSGLFSIILPSGTTQVRFGQYDNYSSDVPYDGREWDDIRVEELVPPAPQIVSLSQPYVQDFSTKPSRSDGWTYESTNEGRIVVDGSLRMDDSRGNSTYSLNEAILHVNLQGDFDAYLSGTYRDVNDEEHDQDGVFISDGVTWEKLDITIGTFEILIPNSTTKIKFSQYDNYSFDNDGREWDNIKIESYDHTMPIAWPDGLGYVADILINGGWELTASGTAAPKALGWTYEGYWSNSYSENRAFFDGSSSDLNGALLYPDGQPRYVGVFYNGGSATHGKYIGKVAVPLFVENGGFYSGSCAGLFMALQYRYDLVPGLGAGSNSGISGWHTVTVDPSSSFAPYLEKYVPDLSMRVQHFYGPILKEKWTPAGVELIGTISQSASSISHMNGTRMATFSQQPGYGPVFVQVSHPEYGSNATDERLGWQMAALEMLLDHTDMVPDIKGTLSVGGTVRMIGPTQTVGDNQYHRFTIDVPAEANTMDVSLTGLSANTDLFVQCDSPANEKSYLAKGTNAGVVDESVQVNVSQACSVLHVSVYGAHEIKNGAAYALSVA